MQTFHAAFMTAVVLVCLFFHVILCHLFLAGVGCRGAWDYSYLRLAVSVEGELRISK